MTLYLNGPVQNGSFTLADRPGKAVGIRLAQALNGITGVGPAPHLWNTVTLTGDLRHRAAADALSRREREQRAVAEKYAHGSLPTSGVLTDADPAVAALALEVCAELLEAGTLLARRVPVRLCAACGHLAGHVDRAGAACRACGREAGTRPALRRLLVHDRPTDRPVLEPGDFHAHRARTPAHLLTIAGDVPRRLLLSRTRDHGITLTPLGLDEGLVLDPRLGVHLTALAAAARHGDERPVMTLTENAAANIAAYGALVRHWHGTRLRYALHGRIPCPEPDVLRQLYAVHRVEPALQDLFTRWYLPLCAWHERRGVTPARLPALLKFLRRAELTCSTTPLADGGLAELRHAVQVGDSRWVTDSHGLARAITRHRETQGNTRPLEGPNRCPTHGTS
jgi:hypothetical protein